MTDQRTWQTETVQTEQTENVGESYIKGNINFADDRFTTAADTSYTDSDIQAVVTGSGTLYSNTGDEAGEDKTAATPAKKAAEAVRAFISESSGSVQFSDIESVFKDAGFDYRGDKYVAVKKNLVVWYGWSDEAVDIINGLIEEGKIKVVADSVKKHKDVSNELSSLPVAKKMKDYKKLHWLPAHIEIA